MLRLQKNGLATEDAPARRPSACVLGLGYVGLPTASILADHGYQVCGVDVRPAVVESVNRGAVHIHEPRLGELVSKVVAAGSLRAAYQPEAADVFLICVPTPTTADRTPDLTFVEQASRAIRPHVRRGNAIILESTCPPGTTQNIVVANAVPSEWTVGEDVFVAYCPERVLPGRILIEAVENDRIVGGVTEACAKRVGFFLKSFITGQLHLTTAINAEIAKLAENAFRDVNIAFANELSMLAENLGADPLEIIRLANRHPRVNILSPGPGVGGHCISVDPWFLVHAAPQWASLIRTAREVNELKTRYVTDRVQQIALEHRVARIGCLGLTYKADVDDLRESPSLEIARELLARDFAEVLCCDPLVESNRVADLKLCPLDELLAKCDMIVLLTDHQEFRRVPLSSLRGKLAVDTRGVWNDASQPRPMAAMPQLPRRHAA